MAQRESTYIIQGRADARSLCDVTDSGKCLGPRERRGVVSSSLRSATYPALFITITSLLVLLIPDDDVEFGCMYV